MAIKRYKPTTPGRRGMTVTDYSGLSKVAPEKSLLEPVKKHSGRNNTGRITVRHQGGGNRRKYRVIDFKREKLDMPATVLTLEYDPNRSAHIALVQYEDGEKRYILAPVGLKVGDTVVSGPAADIKPGNALPLANIPVGGPADGQGRQVRHDPSAQRRAAQCAAELHGYHWPGRQHRPREREHR